jgi:hypothetical protein
MPSKPLYPSFTERQSSKSTSGKRKSIDALMGGDDSPNISELDQAIPVVIGDRALAWAIPYFLQRGKFLRCKAWAVSQRRR